MRTVSLSTRQQERAVWSPQRTTSVVTGATFVTARLKSEGIGALHPQCIPKELIAAMPHMGIDGGMDECSGSFLGSSVLSAAGKGIWRSVRMGSSLLACSTGGEEG